jgi:hypothetical protein
MFKLACVTQYQSAATIFYVSPNEGMLPKEHVIDFSEGSRLWERRM